MRQPKTRRGRASRDAIVAAAAALMYERGVRATGLDEVLLAAGAGKSQLYHYFDTKDDLVAAVLEHQLGEVLAEQARFRLDTWRGLRGWFDALLAGQRARGCRGCPVGSLASEMTAMGPATADRVGAAFARWQATLQAGFEAMRSSGRLRPGARPDVLATVALSQIQGAYLLSAAAQDPEPMRQGLEAAYAGLRAYGRSR
jgi:AcrR family transcriptional regulator